MLLKTHDKRVWCETPLPTSNPLVIWLTRRDELVIEKGDRLLDIARVIKRTLPPLSLAEAGKLAAFYFALGERAAHRTWKSPWTKAELQVVAERRYLTRKTVTKVSTVS